MRLVLAVLALVCVAGDSFAGCKGRLFQRFKERRIAPVRTVVKAVQSTTAAPKVTPKIVYNGQTCTVVK